MSHNDALLILFGVLAVTFLGTSIGFLVLWQIADEDRDATKVLYNECQNLIIPDVP